MCIDLYGKSWSRARTVSYSPSFGVTVCHNATMPEERRYRHIMFSMVIKLIEYTTIKVLLNNEWVVTTVIHYLTNWNLLIGLLFKSMFKILLKHVDCFKMIVLDIKQTTIRKIRDFLVSTIYVFQYQHSHAFHTFIRKYGIFLENIHSFWNGIQCF